MTEPRVLHVITGLRTGGAETMLAKLLGETSLPATVVCLTGDGPMSQRIRETGTPLDLLGMRPGVPDPRAIAGLARIIRRDRPDVVQTWMYHADLLGGLAARLAGNVPVVWNIRQSTLDAVTSKLHTRMTVHLCARLSRRLPRRIVCCSENGRTLHAGLGYEADRITVIPNGFDTAAYRPDSRARAEVRRDLGVEQDVPLIGCVARLDPQKDHENFFAAAARLRGLRPDVQYLLCGDGMELDNRHVRSLVERYGLADRVHLLGRRSDVQRVMAALDVLASSSYQEGFPNVIGEAMSVGIPCVVTDAGDSAGIVGDAGSVVPVRNPEELATGLHRMLEIGDGERRALGARARQRIIERFSMADVARRYDDLHRGVASGEQPNLVPR